MERAVGRVCGSGGGDCGSQKLVQVGGMIGTSFKRGSMADSHHLDRRTGLRQRMDTKLYRGMRKECREPGLL